MQEQRYRLQFLREDGRQRALVLFAIAFGYALSAFNDVVLLKGKPELFALALATRLLLLAIAVAVFVLFRRVELPRRQDRIFDIALVAVAILLSANHITRILVGRVVGTLAGSAAVLGFFYFALRGPVVPRVLFGGVISLGAVAMVLAPHVQAVFDPQARLALLTVVVALNAVGILSARSFEQQRRQRFDAEQRERRANRELEKRLRELAIEKERAEVLSRARATFLAAMSHEFRTPMNAVIGLSDMMLESPFGPGNQNHIRVINDSARALLRLLEDILDFAKIDAQKLTLASVPFDLRLLCDSVMDMLRPIAAARSVTLSVEFAQDVPACVRADDARLRQVLVNLVGNAVKFTRHGSVQLKLTTPPTESSESQSGPAITFRIADTGIGMTAEVISRLFRPFEQGDAGHARRHGGTGLGLAISKQIVTAMGGSIEVESEPGRGSVFSFTIKLVAAEAGQEDRPLIVTDRTNRPPLTILVVDDHPINREVALAKLIKLGYKADLAEDGPAAVAAVSKREYDVVFMDLHMPGMNGLEATARIQEVARRAPYVVAMTASVFEEDREACRRAGMKDFVGKPVDVSELDAVLARVAAACGAVVPPVTQLSKDALDVVQEIGLAGDPHFFERLCKTFSSDARQRLTRMRLALERADAEELARDAHTLKSASAALGATEMSEQCARLEAAAREVQLDGAGLAIEGIEQRFLVAERALRTMLAGAEQLKGAA